MKSLILTFFFLILCYSLFIQDDKEQPAPKFMKENIPFADEKKQNQYVDSVFLMTYSITDTLRDF
jgi:hypothetical protein